ncbi:radical SAM protein [Clostridium magnum]|uniref:Antilisterial bacteriocin subtilosin biosynthesis protein AlbA n=1 Tax=Clostridium magnum DSM 2767 TaxID=1121326 RepID=A0A161X4T4_9CLOT|nr:PqqD family peptide modification chaperone [Clostridium magnum]KZL88936.1 antilisterial bacteriocin subtilosin biosynthesis protein AlbA [Clostridium magnum DSM 2767]SHI54270.1 radical SAM additional 4Fe4S-binding SPASM domain-containing protein [Clostridium magnum DSM 2767]
MYFKIKDNILFRKYKEYGYLTDNSMFGYKMLNKLVIMPGEKYVSESGAVMLGALTKEPRDIETIIKELLTIFIDVDYEELKQDTIDFFMQFVNDGFLSVGETFEKCVDEKVNSEHAYGNALETKNEVFVDDCSKQIFQQNDFLRSLHIEIANECNERCLHCYIPHELKTKVIDSSLFYRIVEEGRNLDIINVTLSGGEPLLHKDFILFLRRCRELDLSVNVLSNLTLLTDEILSEIVKNPLLCVQTSIYSMNPEVHDSITKMKGSLEKTKAGVLKLLELGIPVQISCPIMKQNKESFVDVINWGNDYNITVATDFVIFASYDHTNCNLVNRLSLEEVREAFSSQLTKDYADYLYDSSKEKYALNGDDSICSICRYYLCVSAEGNVFPCVGWQTKKLGNLFENSIKEIWGNSNEIKCLREIKRNSFPQCVSCEDRGYCTVCMMSNSNESKDEDAFKIDEFHCEVAAMMHSRVESVVEKKE